MNTNCDDGTTSTPLTECIWHQQYDPALSFEGLQSEQVPTLPSDPPLLFGAQYPPSTNDDTSAPFTSPPVQLVIVPLLVALLYDTLLHFVGFVALLILSAAQLAPAVSWFCAV
jgi:hypothetical protein